MDYSWYGACVYVNTNTFIHWFRLWAFVSFHAHVISIPQQSSHSVSFCLLFCLCQLLWQSVLREIFYFQYTDNQTITNAHQSFLVDVTIGIKRTYCWFDRIGAHLLTFSFPTHLCYFVHTKKRKHICAIKMCVSAIYTEIDIVSWRFAAHTIDFHMAWRRFFLVYPNKFILIACVNVNLTLFSFIQLNAFTVAYPFSPFKIQIFWKEARQGEARNLLPTFA